MRHKRTRRHAGIGEAYQHVLTRAEQRSLATGCDLLIDQTFDDLILLLQEPSAAWEQTALSLHLPDRLSICRAWTSRPGKALPPPRKLFGS